MSEPYTLELVRIRKVDGEILHVAADERTVENILDTSSVYTYLNRPDIQFEADFLGEVQVYLPDWVIKDIHEQSGR